MTLSTKKMMPIIREYHDKGDFNHEDGSKRFRLYNRRT